MICSRMSLLLWIVLLQSKLGIGIILQIHTPDALSSGPQYPEPVYYVKQKSLTFGRRTLDSYTVFQPGNGFVGPSPRAFHKNFLCFKLVSECYAG